MKKTGSHLLKKKTKKQKQHKQEKMERFDMKSAICQNQQQMALTKVNVMCCRPLLE